MARSLLTRSLPLILLAACSGKSDDTAVVTPAGPPTWDDLAATVPCALDEGEAPLLDDALADAGLSAAEVGYDDDAWEGASYADYLDDSFLLPWFRAAHWDPLRLPCLGGQVSADLDVAATSAHPVASALGVAMGRLDHTTEAAPIDPDDATQDLIDLSGLPDDLATALTPVIAAIVEAAAARAALAAAAPDDLEQLVSYGHGGVIIDYEAAPDLTDIDVQDWVLGTSGPRVLYDPARVLAFAVEEADLGRFAGTDATLQVETELGLFVVAGPGADAPGDLGPVAFYLDLGGDDAYVHPAGASSADVPVAVHIDLGGADTYGYEEDDSGDDGLLPADSDGRYRGDSYYGEFSLSLVGRQGSGRLGVGLLFDLGGGDDSYQSLRMSQGWGQLGVGALYDDGGNDVYLGEAGVQGAASMGIGLLLDAGGNDERRSFAQSQGFGYLQAVGVAWDGGGDDVWYLDPGKEEDGGIVMYYSPQMPGTGNSTFGQGAGFGRRDDTNGAFLSGGVGALRDVSGDDSYTASTFAQGSGYWQGIGMLLDGAGSDLYDAYYYVQGGSAHYAVGMLLDDGDGDDGLNTRMTPAYMHYGAGHDYSAGVFVNESGDDTYVYGGLAAGASNCQGVGLMVDNDGVDTYNAASTYSTGLGNHSSECDTVSRRKGKSTGLFVDSGGDDDTYVWVGGDAHPTPENDAVFGVEYEGTADEHGGAVDGDGETGVHAGGAR